MNNNQTPSDAKYDFRGQPQYMKYFFEPGAIIRACIKGVSYPMNPYALRTCAVGSSCHVLTDLK